MVNSERVKVFSCVYLQMAFKERRIYYILEMKIYRPLGSVAYRYNRCAAIVIVCGFGIR
jgi:hypothetical protein